MITAKFEQKVKETIKEYQLCSKKDKVIVACSGGKDSTTVLYLLHKFGYNVEGMIIDLLIGKWSNQNLENTKRFCADTGIKLHIVNLRKELGSSMCFIRSKVQKKIKVTNCFICGIIKRWLINKKARELGATKLATGHNLDDAAETVLMNLLKGNLSLMLGMGPKTGLIKDQKFVPRIKPLYFCSNSEVREYSRQLKFPVLYEPCPCAANVFRHKLREQLKNKSDKEKTNLVNFFLEMLPVLKKKYQTKEKMNYCSACGEPSRGKFCKMCQLLKA